jgi:hypothetical protein
MRGMLLKSASYWLVFYTVKRDYEAVHASLFYVLWTRKLSCSVLRGTSVYRANAFKTCPSADMLRLVRDMPSFHVIPRLVRDMPSFHVIPRLVRDMPSFHVILRLVRDMPSFHVIPRLVRGIQERLQIARISSTMNDR